MRALIGALTVASVALLGPAAPADAAKAKTEYVSNREYRAVHAGMTRAQVHRKFGFGGRVVLAAGGMHPNESRHYRSKWGGKKHCIAIDYQQGEDGRWYALGKSRPFARYQGKC